MRREVRWKDLIEETFGDQEFLRRVMKIEIKVDKILRNHPEFSGEKLVGEMPGKEKLAFLAGLLRDEEFRAEYPHETDQIADFLRQIENGDLVAPKDYYDLPGEPPVGLLWNPRFKKGLLVLTLLTGVGGAIGTICLLEHSWAWMLALTPSLAILFIFWITDTK